MKSSSERRRNHIMKNRIVMKAAAAATALALILCGCFFGTDEKYYAAPVITAQPSDIQTQVGENVAFEASAQGEGLTYQWYYKKYDFSGWKIWKGHDTPKTFAIANETWNGMRVYCCIKDKYNRSIATRAALISLGNAPVICSQPRSVTVNLGETAYFRVEASGDSQLKYQWYYKKSNSFFWTKWRGHTYPETEAVSNNSWNGMQVFCIVTDSTGGSVSSDPASITVIDSPTVLSQPESTVLSAEGTARLSVNGGTEGLHYQWFSVPKEAKYGIRMKDRNESDLSITTSESENQTQYYCALSCPGGSTVITEKAAISRYGSPTVTLSPQPVAEKTGEKMTFSVRASGDGLKYQWYFRQRQSNVWFPLAGHTGSDISLTAFPALSGGKLRCEVTDRSGNKTTSLPTDITVNDKINITLQPKDTTVSPGEKVILRTATDADGAHFQWYGDKGDGFGWKKLAGQTSSEFVGMADSPWHGMKLRCMITADGCPAVFSKVAVITVNNLLTLTSSPKDISAPSGEKVKFTVKASGRDLKYQWMRMDKGKDVWVSWKGQNGQSAELPAERDWHRMKVRCDVSDCTGKTISSDTADVWITDALDILRQPRSVTVRAYELTDFSVIAQGKGLRYQWYYQKKGTGRWHMWKKHNTAYTSAISNPTWDGMKVMCVITDAYGDTMESKPSVVTILE